MTLPHCFQFKETTKMFKCLAVVALLALSGCKTNTIQVIETDGDKQIMTSPTDFGNESYIWESWIFPNVRK